MSQTVIRRVGSAARFNTSRHSLGLYRCVINTAQYTVSLPIEQQVAIKTIIENALATVVMQHGILRVGIANEDSQDPAFIHLKSIDLHQMIEWKGIPGTSPVAYIQELLRSTEAQHDTLWEGLDRKPGWKLIVHQNNQDSNAEHVKLDITFAFHHAYADGQSAFIFHRDLLRALNSAGPAAPEELQDHVLHLKEPAALPAGAEVIVPFATSWPYLLRLIWSEIIYEKLVPSWMKTKPGPATIPWTGNPINPEPHKANLRLVHVPPEVLASLLAACREHHVTLTPLLHALVLASLASRMPSDAAPAFACSTAISLRRFTKPGEFDRENALHCLVTSHRYLADASTTAAFRASTDQTDDGPQASTEPLIWSTAAKIGTGLHTRVKTLPRDDIAGLTGMVPDWRERWVGEFGKKRDVTWECSNAGSIKIGDAGGSERGEDAWKIERSIFSQGATPVGSAFALNVAGVEGKGLWMTVSWQETTVETALMEGLAQDLQKWTYAFASTGSFNAIHGGDEKGGH